LWRLSSGARIPLLGGRQSALAFHKSFLPLQLDEMSGTSVFLFLRLDANECV
jgi:hypothetical protein